MLSAIFTSVPSTSGRIHPDGRALVRTSPTTLYAFTACGTTAGQSNFAYYKSTTNGISWVGPFDEFGVGGFIAGTVWYDQWTRGNTGSLIHIWAYGSVADDIVYWNLDTATDTLSSPVTVFNGGSTTAGTNNLSGCRARGGNLYIYFDIDGGTETGFYRSTDVGASWGSRTSPFEAVDDRIIILPGEHADDQDIDAGFWDVSADEITRKVYDDSANSWPTETLISAGMVELTGTPGPQWSAMVRHSDGALVMAAWNAFADAGADDLKMFSVAEDGTVTTLTDVNTNTDDCYLTSLLIDQLSGRLTVFYAGKSDGSQTVGSSVGLYFKYSTDGGTSWSSEQDSGQALANITGLFGCPSAQGTFPDVEWLQATSGNSLSSLKVLSGEFPWAIVSNQAQIIAPFRTVGY